MPSVRSSKLACFVCAGLLAASCSGADGESVVRVFAASSLTDAFTQLAADFEQSNPGVEVQLNLGGSSALREQIRAGAPADVLAVASEQIVADLVDEGFVDGSPVIFASNSLLVAVPSGNPGAVSGVEDLANDDLLVGLCAEAVPCGTLAIETLDAAGVSASVDTNEPDVRALLTKIELGELDVGLVYESDVVTAGESVDSFNVGVSDPPVTNYPIATLADSGAPDSAQAFVDFVLSSEAAEVLTELGFGAGS